MIIQSGSYRSTAITVYIIVPLVKFPTHFLCKLMKTPISLHIDCSVGCQGLKKTFENRRRQKSDCADAPLLVSYKFYEFFRETTVTSIHVRVSFQQLSCMCTYRLLRILIARKACTVDAQTGLGLRWLHSSVLIKKKRKRFPILCWILTSPLNENPTL